MATKKKPTKCSNTLHTKKRKIKYDPDKHCGANTRPKCVDCGERVARGKCTNPKGYRTMHFGSGKCHRHGGGGLTTPPGPKLKHGLNAKSPYHTERLESAIARVRRDVADPLDLKPELELLRALVIDYLERYDEFKESVIAFHESFDPAFTALIMSGDGADMMKACQQLRGAFANRRPREVLDISAASILLDRIRKMVDTINTIMERRALTPERVKQWQEELVMIVTRHCDTKTLKKIVAEIERRPYEFDEAS